MIPYLEVCNNCRARNPSRATIMMSTVWRMGSPQTSALLIPTDHGTDHMVANRIKKIIQDAASGCSEGLVESFINVPQAIGPILQLPCCPSKQLSENTKPFAQLDAPDCCISPQTQFHLGSSKTWSNDSNADRP